MIIVKATADTSRAALLASQLSPQQAKTAVSRGINSTLLIGRTEARKAVKAVYNIPQRYLGGIDIKKSYPSFLQGSVNASAKPLPMDAFSPKFSFTATSQTTISRKGVSKTKLNTKSKKRMGAGVMIEVKKGESKAVPFAFMLPTLSGRVFARGQYAMNKFVKRHTRLPYSTGNDSVTPLLSVSVHSAVINDKVEVRIADKLNTHFPANVLHQLEVIANGVVR